MRQHRHGTHNTEPQGGIISPAMWDATSSTSWSQPEFTSQRVRVYGRALPISISSNVMHGVDPDRVFGRRIDTPPSVSTLNLIPVANPGRLGGHLDRSATTETGPPSSSRQSSVFSGQHWLGLPPRLQPDDQQQGHVGTLMSRRPSFVSHVDPRRSHQFTARRGNGTVGSQPLRRSQSENNLGRWHSTGSSWSPHRSGIARSAS